MADTTSAADNSSPNLTEGEDQFLFNVMKEAFRKWDANVEANPDSFANPSDMTADERAEASTRYFIELMNEVVQGK